jgi:uncharacterized protein (TIGR03437 family)
VSAACLLLAVLLFRSCLWAQGSGNPLPAFPPDGVVNSANGSPDSLTPNALATLYGSNLALDTAAVSLNDIPSALLPTMLAGVRVIVGGFFASLLYVSPTQVNFLMPVSLVPGQTDISVLRGITRTPTVQITLLDAAPALFVANSAIVAQHADGNPISPDSPAHPGEVIVVYGTGLGRTDPSQVEGYVPRLPAPIALLDQLQVLLDGQAVPPESIWYAGIAPGFPGLYQINVQLPTEIGPTPELRVALGDQMSQSSLRLPVVPQSNP